MDIKVLCGRCFEDVIEKRKFYKVGSCNYCQNCYEKIKGEFDKEELIRIVLENYRKMKGEKQLQKEADLLNFPETITQFA